MIVHGFICGTCGVKSWRDEPEQHRAWCARDRREAVTINPGLPTQAEIFVRELEDTK
jgi:hypothetical protein